MGNGDYEKDVASHVVDDVVPKRRERVRTHSAFSASPCSRMQLKEMAMPLERQEKLIAVSRSLRIDVERGFGELLVSFVVQRESEHRYARSPHDRLRPRTRL